MNETFTFRTFQKSDRMALEEMIREAWKYDQFSSPKTARKMARAYLDSCIAEQTFTQVALVNHIPVGIIMGKNIETHRCPLHLRMRAITSIASLLLSKEGRQISKIFGCIQGIDKDLLAQCKQDYEGEVAFFVISKAYRGRGLGRKLFQCVTEYMHSQNIQSLHLFTDTSCNYHFYEHLGMTRRCEKKQTIDAAGQKGDMTFFIYDYCSMNGHLSWR